MKIGIIGVGVVGDAVRQGMELVGHTVFVHDIKIPGSSISNVLDSEICFITVPTPAHEDGSCNTEIVESVVSDLKKNKYKGLVTIKSTVEPGTTDRLHKKLGVKLAMCPEFLKERSAFADFVEHHGVCVIGAYDKKSFELIKQAHGKLPERFEWMQPREAEFCKYFSNIYNALRITFANEFFEVCNEMGVDYNKIKDVMVTRDTIKTGAYLDCNPNLRGFGGVCLPKDTRAFAVLAKKLGLKLDLYDCILNENKKFKLTVKKGMRLS